MLHYHICYRGADGEPPEIDPLLGPAVVYHFEDRAMAFEAVELEHDLYGDAFVVGCLLSHDYDGVLEQMAQERQAFREPPEFPVYVDSQGREHEEF